MLPNLALSTTSILLSTFDVKLGWFLTLSIDAGVVDYLSISHSRTLETAMLQRVFPAPYWTPVNDEEGEKAREYDFIGNAKLASEAVGEYLDQAKSFQGNRENAPRQCWEAEFLKTYGVGQKLQELGLHPRVSIG